MMAGGGSLCPQEKPQVRGGDGVFFAQSQDKIFHKASDFQSNLRRVGLVKFLLLFSGGADHSGTVSECGPGVRLGGSLLAFVTTLEIVNSHVKSASFPSLQGRRCALRKNKWRRNMLILKKIISQGSKNPNCLVSRLRPHALAHPWSLCSEVVS